MCSRANRATFEGVTYKHLIDTIDYSHWTDSQELPTISPSITKPDVAA